MKVIILGNMLGYSSGFSINTVNSIYDYLIKNNDVYPYFIRGLDELDRLVKRVDFDGLFIVTYGGFGNDGTLQKILEKLKIRFNNNNCYTHTNCYNKLKTYDLLDSSDILHPSVLKTPQYPCVLKPILGESGEGVKFIKSISDYNSYNNEKNYLEEYIKSDCEYTISIYKGVVGNPVKIVPDGDIWSGDNPKQELLDYEEKSEIRDLVLNNINKIYDVFKANSGLRIDFRIKDNKAYFFDVNSMPIINDGGYYLRSLNDYDNNINFEFVINDMFNDI